MATSQGAWGLTQCLDGLIMSSALDANAFGEGRHGCDGGWADLWTASRFKDSVGLRRQRRQMSFSFIYRQVAFEFDGVYPCPELHN